MRLVEERAAAHGHLTAQKLVVEQCDHRTAEQQVLLHLVLRRLRHNSLMGQNILTGYGDHFISVELLRICQRSTSSRPLRSPFNGDKGIAVSFSGSQS
jgi:hypothetical protein